MLLNTWRGLGSKGGARFFTTFLKKDPNKIKLNDLRKSLQETNTLSNDADVIRFIRSINDSSNSEKSEIQTEIIEKVNSFSIFHSLKDLKFPTEPLLKLIEMNPGRAVDTWELFDKNSSDKKDPKLLIKIAKKILSDEISPEQNRLSNIINLARVLHLISNVDTTVRATDITFWKSYIDKVDQCEIGLVPSRLIPKEIRFEILDEGKSSDLTLLALLQSFIRDNDELIGAKNLIRSIEIIDSMGANKFEDMIARQKQDVSALMDASKFLNRVSLTLVDQQLKLQIFQFVRKRNLDLGITTENLLLRIKSIGGYAIHLDNIDQALALFNSYQSRQKVGIDLVQQALAKGYCFQAIKEDKKSYLKVAEALTVEDSLTISHIQCLMLARAHFDLGSAIDIYNKYIGESPHGINPSTNRSVGGKLTESLVLSCLLNEDTEIANLVLLKARENGILFDQYEADIVKSWMKKYSDTFFISDDVRINMRNLVLNFISSLPL